MSSNPGTVYVSSAMTPALGEPQFVIEHEGKVYLTLAVAAYCSDKEPTDAERLRDMLNHGASVKAVVYGHAVAARFANTDVPPTE